MAVRLDRAARVGLEDSVPWGEQIRWSEAVDAETVPLTETVEKLRAVKDRAELARMQAAARIADEALATAEPMLPARCDRVADPAGPRRRHPLGRRVGTRLRHDRGLGTQQRPSPCTTDRPAVAGR